MQEYTKIHAESDFCQFLWNVETGKVVINRWNRCERNFNSTTEGIPSYKALTWYTIDESDRDLFSEIAIPINFLPDAIKTIQTLVQKYTAFGAKFVDINIRFVDRDTHAYLSPSSEGPVACFAFCILEEDKYLACYREFEEAMSAYGGRPHWGKLNFLDYEKASSLYGENFQRFIKVKQRLDPHEIFSNGFTDRVFKSRTRCLSSLRSLSVNNPLLASRVLSIGVKRTLCSNLGTIHAGVASRFGKLSGVKL